MSSKSIHIDPRSLLRGVADVVQRKAGELDPDDVELKDAAIRFAGRLREAAGEGAFPPGLDERVKRAGGGREMCMDIIDGLELEDLPLELAVEDAVRAFDTACEKAGM